MSKILSTFDRLMENEDFKEEFNLGYSEFLMNEIFLLIEQVFKNE